MKRIPRLWTRAIAARRPSETGDRASSGALPLEDYYSLRAPEYDAIYARPERQRELAALRDHVTETFRGRVVLEIACGTGYWTQALAQGASRVVAVDASPRMLELAGQHPYAPGRVAFRLANAMRLDALDESGFTGCFAGFWWSHLPRDLHDEFVHGLCRRLEPGARCAFVDNRFVPGFSTAIAETDGADTYQDRRLASGEVHRVLKNFPRDGELLEFAHRHGDRAELVESEWFWRLSFEARCPSSAPAEPHP